MGKKKQLGYSAEQISAGAKAREKAASATPAAVLEAFLPERIQAGGLPLLPVTMSTIIALQKVGSGLLNNENAADFSMEDIARTLCVLTTPAAAMRALIASGKFEAAAAALADAIPAVSLPPIAQLLNQHLAAAFSTAIPFGPKDKGDPNSPFPAARTQEPGSAGSPP